MTSAGGLGEKSIFRPLYRKQLFYDILDRLHRKKSPLTGLMFTGCDTRLLLSAEIKETNIMRKNNIMITDTIHLTSLGYPLIHACITA